MLENGLKKRIPNCITLSRLVLMPFSLYCLHSQLTELAFLAYVVIALSDFWDGRLARRWDACSQSGIVLDQACDKVVGLGFFGGLTAMGLSPLWFLALISGITILLALGYLLSQFHPIHSGAQSSLRLGKWSTALQYLWIGWLILSQILFGKTSKVAYVSQINLVGFVFLSLLQVWVFLKYTRRWWKQSPLEWSHN